MNTIDKLWNGFCPESQLHGKQVRMRLNRHDFFESEATGLQIARVTLKSEEDIIRIIKESEL